MDEQDIKIIIQLLEAKERKDLVGLLRGSVAEVEQTGQFGSYWNSIISYFNIYLPADAFIKSKSLAEADKKVIYDCVLDLYPLGNEGPEIQGVYFYVKRDDANEEDVGTETAELSLGEKIEFDKSISLQYEFFENQLAKCDELFSTKDYAGVLTCARTIVESATFDLYKRITGEEVFGTGSLGDDYKKVKSLLNLAPEKKTNAHAKKLTSSLISIIDALDALSNEMGDRHVQKAQPQRHHALMGMNAANAVVSFLYASLVHQYQEKDTLYQQIVDHLYKGSNRGRDRDSLLNDVEMQFVFSRCDEFTKGLIKKRLVSEFEINHFKDSDVFFKALELMGNIQKKEDITLIKKKCEGNSQACGLEHFLEQHAHLLENDSARTPEIVQA